MYLEQPEKIRDELSEEIRRYCEKAGVSRVVLGISGGKDSSVAAALSARALGPENVFGIMLPDGEQKDISDSRRVCKALGIQSFTVNIGEMHQAMLTSVREGLPETGKPMPYGTGAERESNINVGPRLRMTTLRYIAQAIGALLCGTGNLSESYVGYCTKDGDTSCDFNPLGKLTSKEIVELGLSMPELPRDLVNKAPADGLSGSTDEERLGVSYQQIHDLIRHGSSGDTESDEIIRKKHRQSAHKRALPTVLVSETFLREGHEFYED